MIATLIISQKLTNETLIIAIRIKEPLVLRVDAHGYQTLKYLVLIYHHGYLKSTTLVITYNHGSRFQNCQIAAWKIAGYLLGFFHGTWRFFEGLTIPATNGSLILIIFKYLDPVVL
jgi:hypothetical protein